MELGATGARRWPPLLLVATVNPHVIDRITLGKTGFVNAFGAAPGASDRQVQNQELIAIKGPGIGSRTFIFISEILFVIHKKVHVMCIPFESINMKCTAGVRNSDLAAFAGF